MSTFQAVVFILKSLVDLGMYLAQKIKKDEYLKRLAVMDDLIYKASNGALGERLKAGQDIETQINSHTGVKP